MNLMKIGFADYSGIMSFVRNFEPEGRHLHGGYRSTYDGNNFGNNNRKRSRNDYHHRNYNIQNNNWANFGDHGGNCNFYRADHANYAKYDAVPASLKRRKYAAPAWEDSQMYYLPYTVQNNFSSANFQAPPTRSNADTSTSASLQLDWSIFEDDKPSFMSRDEIDRYSPSRKDGIDVRHETHLRYSYCAYLQNLGMRLELPQTTIGTAMVLCHRFFVRRSHACHDRFLIATAALFLAAKSEESPRPLNNVLRASSEILHKQDFTMLSYLFPIDWFEQYRERLFEAEQLILTTLNFELNVQHPYAPLTSVLNKLGLSKTILVNLALNLDIHKISVLAYMIFLAGGLICCSWKSEYVPWNLIGATRDSYRSPNPDFPSNALLGLVKFVMGMGIFHYRKKKHSQGSNCDIRALFMIWNWSVHPLCKPRLRSSLWLQFKPEHIAAGAAYLAAKFLNMDLAADRNIWQEFQTTPSILQDYRLKGVTYGCPSVSASHFMRPDEKQRFGELSWKSLHGWGALDVGIIWRL
ncbi:hypothetical protein Ahy_A09g042330 isoform A [Arachis hypogaea]|uniref:B-like cyclin n=1 Tax=Arachis hypogaea TaxID=3818 RepID=A0A445BFI9_ARAHY|nr:hypothetical protein Ahy_A09g042330 isoform A [Arachis hypogaea]